MGNTQLKNNNENLVGNFMYIKIHTLNNKWDAIVLTFSKKNFKKKHYLKKKKENDIFSKKQSACLSE